MDLSSFLPYFPLFFVFLSLAISLFLFLSLKFLWETVLDVL